MGSPNASNASTPQSQPSHHRRHRHRHHHHHHHHHSHPHLTSTHFLFPHSTFLSQVSLSRYRLAVPPPAARVPSLPSCGALSSDGVHGFCRHHLQARQDRAARLSALWATIWQTTRRTYTVLNMACASAKVHHSQPHRRFFLTEPTALLIELQACIRQQDETKQTPPTAPSHSVRQYHH